MKESLNKFDGARLSPHFLLSEFLNVGKYPDNKPTLQDVANMTYSPDTTSASAITSKYNMVTTRGR